jgi:serine/threonine protein kinase
MQGALMPDRSLEVSRVGQYIGNYQLIRRLGKGGFAEVYLGQHLHLPRQAAIKLLLNSSLTPSENKKFRAEAQIVASLRHPHIVQILDFGIDSTSGLPYLIMDYAPDGTLRQLHPRGSVLPPATILSYLRQIASALDFAHRNNVVHRDIKPENMLLSAWEDGVRDNEQNEAAIPNILLSDFGIAMLTVRRPEISLASVPELAGTPYYMAPEQLRGKAVAASDQYALGVVVYEWLCGRAPFHGNMFQIANQHLNTSPPPPSEYNPQISPALEDVMLRSLSKSPTRRYPTVSAFATAFADALVPAEPPALASTILPRVVHHIEPTIPSSRVSDSPTRPASAYGVATIRSKPPISLKRRAILMTLGGAVVVGGVAGGLWWMEGRQVGTGQGTTSTGNKRIASPINNTPTTIPALTTLHMYSGHKDIVYAVAWSMDGRYIVSGSKDQTAQIWDAVTAEHIITYKEHSDIISSVAWSPDTKHVVSGSYDQTVQVWDIQGKKITTNNDVHRIISSVSWSSKSNRVAASSLNGDEVLIFESDTGKFVTSFNTNTNFVYSIAWSPDGTRIAAACAGGTGASAQVWDITTTSRQTNYTGHKGGLFAIAWSFDGKYVASGGNDKTIHVWRPDTGDQVQVYGEHKGEIYSVDWSPKELLVASGSADKTVRIWATPSNTTLHTYTEHQDSIRAVSWSSDGSRIASGSADKTVKVWQAI